MLGLAYHSKTSYPEANRMWSRTFELLCVQKLAWSQRPGNCLL